MRSDPHLPRPLVVEKGSFQSRRSNRDQATNSLFTNAIMDVNMDTAASEPLGRSAPPPSSTAGASVFSAGRDDQAKNSLFTLARTNENKGTAANFPTRLVPAPSLAVEAAVFAVGRQRLGHDGLFTNTRMNENTGPPAASPMRSDPHLPRPLVVEKGPLWGRRSNRDQATSILFTNTIMDVNMGIAASDPQGGLHLQPLVCGDWDPGGLSTLALMDENVDTAASEPLGRSAPPPSSTAGASVFSTGSDDQARNGLFTLARANENKGTAANLPSKPAPGSALAVGVAASRSRATAIMP